MSWTWVPGIGVGVALISFVGFVSVGLTLVGLALAGLAVVGLALVGLLEKAGFWLEMQRKRVAKRMHLVWDFSWYCFPAIFGPFRLVWIFYKIGVGFDCLRTLLQNGQFV